MRLYFKFSSKALLIFSLLVFSNTSEAQQVFTVPSGHRHDAATVTGGLDIFEHLFHENTSHCCEIWATDDISDGPRLGPLFFPITDLVVANRGGAKPLMPTSSNDPNRESRKCFTLPENDPTGFTINRITWTINSGPMGTSTTNDVSMLCRETTLYGGYNTSVTDFNFIEIANTLQETVTDNGIVQVFIRAGGVIAGNPEVIDTSIVLGPGGRNDFDVHSLVGTDFGSVVITHDGPPGAITARTVQYRINSTSPFVFTPVSVEVFRVGSL